MGDYLYLVFLLILIYLLISYKQTPAIINGLGGFVSHQVKVLQGGA